jgi:hypothetical protein
MWDPQSRSVQISLDSAVQINGLSCWSERESRWSSFRSCQSSRICIEHDEPVPTPSAPDFNSSFDIGDSLDNALRDDVLYPLPSNGCGWSDQTYDRIGRCFYLRTSSQRCWDFSRESLPLPYFTVARPRDFCRRTGVAFSWP